MGRNFGGDIYRAGNPAAKATPLIPVRSDCFLVVETEPTWSARLSTVWIEHNDLKIDPVSELKPVIVSAHVIVPRPKGHVEVEAFPDMRDPICQPWGDHRDVVELKHP